MQFNHAKTLKTILVMLSYPELTTIYELVYILQRMHALFSGNKNSLKTTDCNYIRFLEASISMPHNSFSMLK